MSECIGSHGEILEHVSSKTTNHYNLLLRAQARLDVLENLIPDVNTINGEIIETISSRNLKLEQLLQKAVVNLNKLNSIGCA